MSILLLEFFSSPGVAIRAGSLKNFQVRGKFLIEQQIRLTQNRASKAINQVELYISVN
jgi:hypothetical protein